MAPAISAKVKTTCSKVREKDILENKCALVVKEGSDIKSWDDFEAAIKAANSSDDLTFAMGNADVPVGQYTSKILTSLGLNEQDMGK